MRSMLKSDGDHVVDPACGDGALLQALRSHGCSKVIGIDCDPSAVRRARRRLLGSRIQHGDGLRFLSKAAGDGGTLDAVIANPPWGATLNFDRATLTDLGYRPVVGQTDSWDLFVDGILRAVRPGGPIVLILPDALFLPEHRAIRRILASESQITLIARLGEGFFPGVYRGTVVVALRKGPPTRKSFVACARLSPDARRNVLAGQSSLEVTVRQCAHSVEQSRFTADPEHRFDIDTRRQDEAHLALIERGSGAWMQLFDVGRGIELSKSGRIVRCPKCHIARPVPRKARALCPSCRHAWAPEEASIEPIVRQNDMRATAEWHPLIVGEDVDRYACVASRMIQTGIPGIRYKPMDVFARPKLLLRKTGVGIKAAVDLSGAATNQVVFHITCRPNTPNLLLYYVAGVLCSRMMLAWHLKRHGEVEWRSHPYITPKIIRGFPVRLPKSQDDWDQVTAIAQAVQHRSSCTRHDSPEDLTIERLVAGFYGLAVADMRWVLDVLDAAQQLEPIRTLRLPAAELVSPLCASKSLV